MYNKDNAFPNLAKPENTGPLLQVCSQAHLTAHIKASKPVDEHPIHPAKQLMHLFQPFSEVPTSYFYL